MKKCFRERENRKFSLFIIRHSVRIKRYMEKDRKREKKIELENDG